MRRRIQVLKKIRKYTFLVKGSVLGLVIANLLAVLAPLISPKFFQILIDEVMRGRRLERFETVVVGLLFVYALRFVSDGLSLILGNRVLNTFTYNVRKDVFQKYKNTPYSFFERKSSGELKMRIIDDVDSLGNFVREQVIEYLSGILTVVLSFYLVFNINKTMTFYCLAIIPLVFLFNHLIGVGTQKVNEDIREINSEYYASTHNSLQFWREIKMQGSEKTFIGRFKKYRQILAKLGLRAIRYTAYREVFNDFKSNYLTKAFVYVVGAFFVRRYEISVGVLIMFAEYFAILFSALDTINTKRAELKVNSPYYERIFETLDFSEEDPLQGKPFQIEKHIDINEISFSYTKEEKTLSHINLRINKGEHVAIIGKTGCGKTTLLKLLAGLYEADEGQILFDGTDIHSISKQSLHENIGVVMSDNFLFDISIRDNLLLAKSCATENEIIEACKKADVYDFILSLPNGLDTQIGERGIKLSGGQRQKIAIAAVLLKRPEIIIFDEVTSALDKHSEDLIHNAINKVLEDATIITVTHRPSTALQAQRVIVMDNGRIDAVGTHKELICISQYYKDFMGG